MNEMTIIAEPGQQSIQLSRTFNAPRELVFKAFTAPDLIPQWWGPRQFKTTVDQMDVRFGGTWRFIQHGEDREEYAFRGVYHYIEPNEKIVQTFEFEGAPGYVSLEIMQLEDRHGQTIVTSTSVYPTVADRDMVVSTGMAEGATESWDRFEELLGRLQTA